MSGINYLHATPFVPLKAFRKLKMIVRLLKIARGVINQLSPFCFCGGREVLRLSQTASPFRGLIEDVNIRSFGEVVSSLACSRWLMSMRLYETGQWCVVIVFTRCAFCSRVYMRPTPFLCDIYTSSTPLMCLWALSINVACLSKTDTSLWLVVIRNTGPVR